MITHVVAYKPRGSGCTYVKLFHSLFFAEKWIASHSCYHEYWILREIKGFHAETGEASYKVLKTDEGEEK